MPTIKMIAGMIHSLCPNIDSTKATMKTSAHWTAFTMLKTRPAFLLSCESAAAACAARFF
jgi:hypothetical protein